MGIPRGVRDRGELARVLTDAMEASYVKFRKDDRQEYERNLLKSYLVEAHIKNENDHYQIALSELHEIAQRLTSNLVTTDDPSLVILHSPKYAVDFYIDLLHPRYWFLHTLSKSVNADNFISRLIKTCPEIDRSWFPSRILEQASGLGRFEGLGVKFDSTIYQSPENENDINTEIDEFNPLDNRLISLSLRTTRGVRKQLARLRDTGVFPYASALSWIRVRVINGSSDTFALEDITYHGKFTARGTSFTDHLHVLITIKEMYELSVRNLETEMAIGFSEDEGGIKFEGEPLVMTFPQPIRNMDEVMPRMFTSAEPYRLWGVPRLINDRLIRVRAVDLHIGQQLSLEITPSNIVAYLPQGTCGNTITRLYSNVQRTLDPQVTIRGEKSWLVPQQVI